MTARLIIVIFLKCIEIKSLFVAGINTVLWVSYTAKTNKFIEKEIRFVITRGQGEVEGDHLKAVKKCKL